MPIGLMCYYFAVMSVINAESADMPLREAHATLVAHAEERLPFQVESAS